MKECPVCHEETTLDDLLLRHMSCTAPTVEKKTALNTSVYVKEMPMTLGAVDFWGEHQDEIISAIELLNDKIAEKNIPLVIAENIGLSEDSKEWYFYVCNKETIEEEIHIGDNRMFTFAYPEEYPTVEQGKYVQELIFADDNLNYLAEQYEDFSEYKVDFKNVKNSSEYEEERREFKKFIFEQEEKNNSGNSLFKSNTILQDARNHHLEKMLDNNLSFWKKFQHWIFYKILWL